jgi:transposase
VIACLNDPKNRNKRRARSRPGDAPDIEQRGLRRHEIAKQLGRSTSSVSAWAGGKVSPSAEVAEQITRMWERYRQLPAGGLLR